ncbi:MAG: SDR family oxidoreductase [Candidatus Aureabacteria bacterium]|nr:SDR family oxidoreductase [Candidatus Auribacterota bacterium]
MKTLVTGGAGFIGSHLVDALLARGDEVVVLDNLRTGRRENLPVAADAPRLVFHQADVADHQAIGPFFGGVERVFHLAARADIVPSIVDPLSYHRSNVDGTVSVLEACRAAGVKRFLYAASSSCYGIPDVYPTPETAPARPQYPYALTKYLGEECVLHWEQVYRLPAVSLRFFNVYGPRARTSGTYGAVFGVFLAQKIHGQPFTVVGDGNQTRDFTFVSDVVTACLAAADSDLSGVVMNVGSGRPVSVNRLVELLEGPVVHIPKRPGEPDSTHADIARIRKLLGWGPKVSIEEGVKILLAHIDCWSQAPVWTPESIGEATRDWFEYLGKDV